MARRQTQGEPSPGPELVYVSVENVVAEALRGVERNRPIVIPGWAMKAGMALVRLAPMPLLRLAGRFSAKRP